MAQSQSAPLAFRLRAGRAFLDATASDAQLAAFIAAANQARQIEGLAEALNPDIIDPDKARHFVAGLARLPAPVLARLAGQDLYLDNNALGIQLAAPTHAAGFDLGFTLTIGEIQGGTVLATADVPVDAALAQSRAQAAEHALSELIAAVEHIEADPQRPGLRLAQERRYAVARVWRMNAAAWAQAAPDAAATASLQRATAATGAYAISPRGGTVPG